MSILRFLFPAVVVSSACGADAPTAPAPDIHDHGPNLYLADVNMDLAAIREATAQFHSLEKAEAAGYAKAAGAPDCIGTGDPDVGDMGFHWDHVEDPAPPNLDVDVDIAHPEALVYMPGPNGSLRLVAVEYLIPCTVVGGTCDGPPPTLMGQEFTSFAPAFPLWGLHAWVWKENPTGMFANFNPKLTCPTG